MTKIVAYDAMGEGLRLEKTDIWTSLISDENYDRVIQKEIASGLRITAEWDKNNIKMTVVVKEMNDKNGDETYGITGYSVARLSNNQAILEVSNISDPIYSFDNDLEIINYGSDYISGNKYSDIINGAAGSDTIYGNAGDDKLMGGTGFDRIYGGEGYDSISGGDQADTLVGNNHGDRLYGEDGTDRLEGGSGWDRLYGGSGVDVLFGGHGRDYLYGGQNADLLDVGNDDDIDYIIFKSRSDSAEMGIDRVVNFQSHEDKVDLAAIDANTKLAGNQAFKFMAGPAKNAVWVTKGKGDVNLYADVNGDAKADFKVFFDDTAGLIAGDFIL